MNTFDPVQEEGTYRGVTYTLAGAYANAEHTAGSFTWKHRWGFGYGGSADACMNEIRRTIDNNLNDNDEPLVGKKLPEPETP